MITLWQVLSMLLILMVLPGTLYLLLLTLFAAATRQCFDECPMQGRLAIVVPAHNEESGIAATLKSLMSLSEADGNAQVVVVADNCTDNTAQAAALCGARVMTRQNQDFRGKGYALDHAFNILLKEDFFAFAVVDADSVAEPDFIPVLRNYFGRGAKALQVRYTVLNTNDTARTRLAELGLLAFNVLRPRARHAMGLSAGIFGNGFALHRTTLEKVPYTATSVVEDLEYHLRLIKAGIRVHFAEESSVCGEMPTTSRGAETQRARWEGGRLRMMLEHVKPLMTEVLKGRLHLMEPLADLLLLPLSYHVLILLFLCVMPFASAKIMGVAGLLAVLAYILMAARIGNISCLQLGKVLIQVPHYLLWKIRMVSATLRTARRGSDWVRTARNIEFKEVK